MPNLKWPRGSQKYSKTRSCANLVKNMEASFCFELKCDSRFFFQRFSISAHFNLQPVSHQLTNMSIFDTWKWFRKLAQEVSINIARSQSSSLVKMNSNEFAKSRRVIISNSFCISICFHCRIRCNNLIFKWSSSLQCRWFTRCCCHNCEKLNYSFGIDSFASTRFAWISQNWLSEEFDLII